MEIASSFPHLDPDEKVVLVLRKHPLILLKTAIRIFFFFVAPPIIYIILMFAAPEVFEFEEAAPVPHLIILGLSVYYLYAWLFSYIFWLEYYLDVWVVTNERVINIDQRQLFFRKISEVRLTQVQDITTESKGMLHTFFKFGDIDLQTAAEEKNFLFKNIKHPDEVRGVILKLLKESQTTKIKETPELKEHLKPEV